MLTDDARIRKLNSEWRDQDKPTNVLSFENPEEPPEDAPWQLGDVVVAFGVTAAEAAHYCPESRGRQVCPPSVVCRAATRRELSGICGFEHYQTLAKHGEQRGGSDE